MKEYHRLKPLCVHLIAGYEGPIDLNYVADKMQKQRAAPLDEFEIMHDSSTSSWHVEGAGLQRFVQMTNWRYTNQAFSSLTPFLCFSFAPITFMFTSSMSLEQV